ncbi:hypothetical protein AN639_04485 [Candidatus Epulonipiscium fishelsonii]|uniref:Uncharacterized protein n=1 Tax=Candidatus Epulonipiscium fishelsonii TaxID=77094 RepID=A0ACC8X8G8_9FIRM|nr:hypothetical protein AN396_11175 [Epulopiscium sp. SCG-B11WGA-EpuloA1]ONI40551.1 hypothetical protein AN639_04485 [Epulopiscium sp. SCG-B05WGA-EpuloA1]
MKKLVLKLFLTMGIASTMLVGCGGSTEEASSNVTNASAGNQGASNSGGESIRVFNQKIEIDAALKAYAELYTEKTGINVIIESMGGGADSIAVLKGYLAADNMPDIFTFEALGYDTWKDNLADLAGEVWTEDTDVEFIAPDGRVLGFPYAIEGYGLAYNKDLLDKAGIDPLTLTSYSAYEKAFAKLDGMKEELGIDAVLSTAASVGGGMTWSTGQHSFGSYLATGLDPDDTSIIDGLHAGITPDRARLDQYVKFVDMIFNYSDEYVLISGSYDDQLALWEDQKAVFIHQGNWIDPNLVADGITFNVGIAPYAFLEEETDGILADSPSWWGVYSESPNVQLAKDFLTSLATTPEGEKCLVSDAGMISPYKSATLEPTAPLAQNLKQWVNEGKTYPWHWANMPEGYGTNVLGPLYELLGNGTIDATTFADMIEATIAENGK